MDNFSEIAVCIENINKEIIRIKHEKTAGLGIRNAHFSCMMHIDLTPDGLTPTEISRSCNVDKAFVSRTTADLVNGGFICTNAKFHDGRKYRNKYVLTEKGKDVIREIKNAIEEYFAELVARIGEHEMRSFLKVAVAINGIIEEQIEN